MKKHKLSRAEIPQVLQTIPSPPKELFIIGDLPALLKKPRLTVVGSRRVTTYGWQVTEQLTRQAAQKGIVIISGLALGVDSIAHQAALDVGGATIAVLPASVEEVYPRSHVQLAQRIVEQGGALVSEYPQGMSPRRENFIARNRLVAGLGDAILVTEAAAKSGTLHTVNFALEQGKPVLAIPGNITSAQSEGTNQLIKTGAIPVTDVSDILEALAIEAPVVVDEIVAASPAEYAILFLLSAGTSDGAELLNQSKLEPAIFNQTLTMLEITGRVKALGNNHWSKL